MKLFRTPTAIQDELGQLRRDAKFRREDNATVSAFYNGEPPLTQQEADDLGITVNVNHLFGYTEIRENADQVHSLFTKPGTLVSVQLKQAPPGKGILWGMAGASKATEVWRNIPCFRAASKGCSGDGAMHGESVYYFANSTFPAPKQAPLSKMLIPSDASTDTTDLTHWGMEALLNLKDARSYYVNNAKGWNHANLGAVLSKFYERQLEGRSIDPENAEELEYERQQNSGTSNQHKRRPGFDVEYFYQVRTDKPGNPIDLQISLANQGATSDKKDGGVLYQGECAISHVSQVLHPVFMDCIIGGEAKWHRVLGTGHLNYQCNQAVELLVNRAQQMTYEGSMNMWTAADQGTRDAAQQILMKNNGVLPAGLSMLANRFTPDFSGTFQMIQMFRQLGSKNARGVTPNNGQGNDQLEAQFLAENNAAASSLNNRMADLYTYLDWSYAECWRRLTNPYIEKGDPGYSEVMEFQSAMEREGIPLKYLQPSNVIVKATRLVGNGLRQKEAEIVNFLSTNRNQYAPEVQQKITRITTSLALDNYDLAEELTPMEEETEIPGKVRADDENAVMITMRTPRKPRMDDVDDVHIVTHFPAMERLLTDAMQYQQSAFTPPQAEAFGVIGQHIAAHIQRIEGQAVNQRNDPRREAARDFMEQLTQMAALGDKMKNNMQQMQQGQEQQPLSEAEQAKMQLELEKLQLGRAKLEHNVAKFDRTQGTKEQKMAFDQNMALERDRRDQQRFDSDRARGDIETAVKVATAGRGGSNAPR